jgi:hypothetical protein
MMKNVFWLSTDLKFDDLLEYGNSMRMETELCPFDPQHTIRSRWCKPLRVVGPVRAITDFEWTVYNDILVNQDIVQALGRAGFSGISFEPVELLTTTETPIGREVFELRVVGWGGDAPPESGVRVIKECPFCRRQVFSIYTDPEKLFDTNQWDGSDFFTIWPLPRRIMITPRVRNFFLQAEYSGLWVRDLKELPSGSVKTLTPGNVLDWFDADPRLKIRGRFGNG